MPRVGVGDAKFPAYAAARSSRPLGAARVPADVAGFLAPQPVDLLPIPAGVKGEMRRFSLHTLGDVEAIKVETLADRFGPAGLGAFPGTGRLSLGPHETG